MTLPNPFDGEERPKATAYAAIQKEISAAKRRQESLREKLRSLPADLAVFLQCEAPKIGVTGATPVAGGGVTFAVVVTFDGGETLSVQCTLHTEDGTKFESEVGDERVTLTDDNAAWCKKAEAKLLTEAKAGNAVQRPGGPNFWT
jgi:hypothetical protein